MFWGFFMVNTVTEKKNTKHQNGVTSAADHYSMDICDRKVSAWIGTDTNAFMASRYFQCLTSHKILKIL